MTDSFQQRVSNVFAALGPLAPAPTPGAAPAEPQQRAPQQHEQAATWQLDTNQGFKAGREADASDEDEGAVPQPLPGAAGSDEDEGEYARHASAAFCRCAGDSRTPRRRQSSPTAPRRAAGFLRPLRAALSPL